MIFECDHAPDLSLSDLQTILRSDEEGYGSVSRLRAVTSKDEAGGIERQVTRATHSDEFPEGSLVLKLLMGDESPPASDGETFLFKGKALLLGVEQGVATYRKNSFDL